MPLSQNFNCIIMTSVDLTSLCVYLQVENCPEEYCLCIVKYDGGELVLVESRRLCERMSTIIRDPVSCKL